MNDPMEQPTITIGEEMFALDDIAGLHLNPGRGELIAIPAPNIKRKHLDYTIWPDDTQYPALLAHYKERNRVTLKEEDDAYIFLATHSQALAVLVEELDREHYAYTSKIGGRDNQVRVFKDQGNTVDALDREINFSLLIANHVTTVEEPKDD
jgi:hypothetical protein